MLRNPILAINYLKVKFILELMKSLTNNLKSLFLVMRNKVFYIL